MLIDRRAVRRDQGAARRLLGDRGRRPRRRAGLGRPRPRSPAARRSRSGRSRTSREALRRTCPRPTADAGRAGLPRGVRPGGRDPGPPLRRHRHRRGGGPGRLRRGGRALAADGRAAEPRRLDRHHRAQPRDRPAAPGVVARRPLRPGGRAASATRSRRRPRCEPVTRRPAAADLHLLPPGARAEAQVALTLRLLGGLQTPEIARAFLVPEATMAQRLVRAKHKIRARQHPVPRPGRRRAAGPAAPGARRRLPGLQRGLHGERPATR